jgi:membrane-bound lytic murein transglycosylase B
MPAMSQAADMTYVDWLIAFKKEAHSQGISDGTLESVFANPQPISQVIKLDRSQPEFVQTFGSYLDRRVTPKQISGGQEMLAKNIALLRALEQQFGVSKYILTAFWGMETSYGANKGDFSVPQVLATLAYDGRRPDFFRSQLMDSLRIIDAGHVTAANMQGSWAGAMGHMQFMPSTFNAYGLDGDDDGRVDVWNSLPDVMNSAAYYLKSVGWREGEPIAIEVELPKNFNWEEAQLLHRIPVSEWVAMGVKPAGGSVFPTDQTGVAQRSSAIVLPQGWQGPAFMVFDNFYVIMQWNRSVSYALAVVHLADRIAGGKPLVNNLEGYQEALSFQQMMTIQQKLTEKGFDVGTPDGIPGLRTQTAIRKYQQANHLPVDGYASPSLLTHIQNNISVVSQQSAEN